MATIKILHSAVAGHVPASLVSGQIGINEADGKLFYLGANGATVESFSFKAPALTNPTAATQSAGDNTPKLATTAYVMTAIANVLNGAPGALDTLNELAAALGSDANFAATTATSLGNRVRVDTAAQGLNTTQQGNARTNVGVIFGTAAGNVVVLDGSRNATFPAAITCVDLNYTSDERLKVVHGDMTSHEALSFLRQFQVIMYNWANDPEQRERVGVSAQRVEKFAPFLVSEVDDDVLGKKKVIDWMSITAIVLRSVQFLEEKISSLETRVQRLERGESQS